MWNVNALQRVTPFKRITTDSSYGIGDNCILASCNQRVGSRFDDGVTVGA